MVDRPRSDSWLDRWQLRPLRALWKPLVRDQIPCPHRRKLKILFLWRENIYLYIYLNIWIFLHWGFLKTSHHRLILRDLVIYRLVIWNDFSFQLYLLHLAHLRVPWCSTVSGLLLFLFNACKLIAWPDDHLVVKDIITGPGHLIHTTPGVSFLWCRFHFRSQHMLNSTYHTVLKVGEDTFHCQIHIENEQIVLKTLFIGPFLFQVAKEMFVWPIRNKCNWP